MDATVNSRHSINKNDCCIFYKFIFFTRVFDLGLIIILFSLANFCSVCLIVVLDVLYFMAKSLSFNLVFGGYLWFKISWEMLE